MSEATPDCRCGHSYHGYLGCWDLDCDCPEQRDTPTLAEVWDECCREHERECDVLTYDDQGNLLDTGCDRNPYHRPAAAEGNET